MVQETHMKELPKLPGYRVHASPPSARTSNVRVAQGVCTFVRKGLTLIKLDRFLDCDTAPELCAVEVVIGGKKHESVFLVNAYSNPQHRGQRFKTLLLKEAEEAEFELLSDPQQPSHIGTLITRDTTPDLFFAHLPDDRPDGGDFGSAVQCQGDGGFLHRRCSDAAGVKQFAVHGSDNHRYEGVRLVLTLGGVYVHCNRVTGVSLCQRSRSCNPSLFVAFRVDVAW
ncbi:hypothetical protein MRX96_008506 [Rhipicephalus microplus]